MPSKNNPFFDLRIPQADETIRLSGLHFADSAFVFASQYRSNPRNFIWVCRNNREAEATVENLRFFLPSELYDRVLLIPGSEADPYRGLSPHPDIAESRAIGLWRLLQEFEGFLVTTLASWVSRISSPESFRNHCFKVEVGNFFPLEHFLGQLREMGYMREDTVGSVGEYSRRGGIVDVFSPSRPNPVRLEFFGDELESIREFDTSTQRSIELVPECEIVPMREVVVSDREIALWSERAPQFWNEVRFAESLKEKFQFTENKELFNGFEYLFPLVLDNSYSLLEFFKKPCLVLPEPSRFFTEMDRFYSNVQRSFQERQAEGELALPPERLFFSRAEVERWLEGGASFLIEPLWMDDQQSVQFDFQPERHYQGRIQELLKDVDEWRHQGETVVLVTKSLGMAERMVDMFREYDSAIYFAPSFDEGLTHAVSVVQGKLSEGFYSPGRLLHVLTEENLFEESQIKPALKRGPQRDLAERFRSDFRDLKEGDYVVHVDHGIGIFRGLKKIGVGEDIKEFVVLEYRDEAKLYLPIDRLDLVQKYSGASETRPQVERLGGVSWERTKQRIARSMRHLADDLLKLYARRQISKGYAFPPDDALMKEFEDAFEFTETPDQLAAIRDVKVDMESEQPMDRLICGDVGYGKTEVAMRAAFKSIGADRQVAVLAPTTVLAFQHYNTFRERFRAFPVMVEMVSRFRSPRELKEILKRVSEGTVDILIGTHRLLSKDVHFRNLGLLVIDEEQRFGVPQKEKLKQLKTSVDVLTLSATPIPRTLNMSLIGLRDLSIIETPPKDRLAIQTVVVRFTKSIIRSAIDLELQRQGQVFFVHNEIETIYSIAQSIQETVPQARIGVAHGRMSERQLEEVMLGFVNYRYDVLVCTTIIENGLDIPRANTLIVSRAKRFGLAQLYQLRGRVGRSNRRAYAYLLVSSEETLTTEARQRLAAIREFSDLGAGFRIAALDLEIRGAGNLLGGEQHGQINAVGFELYMKLLEKTIRELKGEEVPEEVQTTVDLRIDIQIPEHYVEDPKMRLWLYKRVSSINSEESLENLKEELVDRFGKYPRSVGNLLEYARLKLRSSRINILSLERKDHKVFMRFREDTPVSTSRVIDMVRKNGDISLTPEGVLLLRLRSAQPEEIFRSLHSVLDEVSVLQ